MRNDNVYLRHILEAIELIESYLKGFDYDSFSKDQKTIDAVVRELEIIGEAARNLSDDFIKKHPGGSFRDAIDMRNILIHEYFGVNKKVVWDTVQLDLEKLKKDVENIIKNSS